MTTTIQAVRDRLLLNADLVTLVGTRVHANKAPQDTAAPYVVMQVISDVPENTLSGSSVGRLSIVRLQVDVYGATYLTAAAVAELTDLVISGLVSSDLAAQLISSRDFYDDGSQLHRVSQDFTVAR